MTGGRRHPHSQLSWSSSFLISILLVYSSGLSFALHPIILVPGDGGSQIEAKLDKPSVVHYICNKKTNDFFNIWLNLELLVPLVIDCWIDNVRLVYNFSTRGTVNSPGVQIRVPGFGNTTTVEYLDPSQASPGLYFKSIVEQSLIPLGYSRNEDIRGAPYDFRKAPNEMKEWLDDFRKLVEHSYSTNGDSSVVLLAHSMGSPLSLYFLSQMSQRWKDKYIRALVTLAGVWGGSVKALKVFAAGDDLGAYLLPAHIMRGQQRTSPSTAWLLPSKHYWGPNEVLVEIEDVGNMTVNDYKKFFDTMDDPVGYQMAKDTENLLHGATLPGVEVHCLHGSGVSTTDSLYYKKATDFPLKPQIIYGNGDGTVNIRSLRGCLRWANGDPRLLKRRKAAATDFSGPGKKKKNGKKPPVFHVEFPGVDHMAILKDPRVINYIRETVGGMNQV